jgi:hypothetical protein
MPLRFKQHVQIEISDFVIRAFFILREARGFQKDVVLPPAARFVPSGGFHEKAPGFSKSGVFHTPERGGYHVKNICFTK